MFLKLPPLVIKKSKSKAVQKSTEKWGAENLYCPKCLLQLTYVDETVKDYDCIPCNESYQLKSQSKSITKDVQGADYNKIIEAINDKTHPSLLVLQYDPTTMFVTNVVAIHRNCLSACCVDKNKSPVRGRKSVKYLCKFLMPEILRTGRVPIVSFGNVIPKTTVQSLWLQAETVTSLMASYDDGWRREVVRYIDQLGTSFNTKDVYACADQATAKYPANNNVQAKVRQIIQDLERSSLIRRVRRGYYER